MDLCLNVTSQPVRKKTEKSAVTKEKSKHKPDINIPDSFDFIWNTNKNIKAGFVRKNTQKIISKKTQLENNSEKIEDSYKITKQVDKNSKTKKESNQINSNHINIYNNENNDNNNNSDVVVIHDDIQINNEIAKSFKRKVFPLFDNFSNVSKIKINDRYVTPATENMFSSIGSTFKDLNIHSHTITNLERIGLTTLTAVQEKTIPEIFAGKNVFVRSQTGSGKTLSYAVPLVERLQKVKPHLARSDGVQALIVVPTRELAMQTYELLMKLVEPFRWLVPGRLCGGEKRSAEKARLRKGLTILVGTPGRLLDHALHTRALRMHHVQTLILDEADRLLDMGFQDDINTLIQQIDQAQNAAYDPLSLLKSKGTHLSGTQLSRQTILLSATLNSNVQDLAKFTMTDYVYVDPLHSGITLDNKSHLSASSEVVIPQSVKQKYIVTEVKTRLVVLSAFIVEKVNKSRCKMLIFMASKQMVEYHELLFKKCLVKRKRNDIKNNVMIMLDDSELTDEDQEDVLDVQFFKLHGSMEQKERMTVFKAFREAEKGVLLCTDVAARGLDIPHADYVVQYTGPLQDEDYVHRVGRTGRAGHTGHALLFLAEPELAYITRLQQKKFHLSRVRQDHILQSLVQFMEHAGPSSAEAAAELLQRRYEQTVAEDPELHKAACLAFSSWSRYYSSYPTAQKEFFDFHAAHLGHYVTSFALRKTPHEVAHYVRTKRHLIHGEKKLNKKLANHGTEENTSKTLLAKPKKRKRGQDLVVSEYDSGLTPIKKKTYRQLK